MPRDSNWKMPLVRPSEKMRKVSGSSSGISSRSSGIPCWRMIFTASSITVSVRRPRKSIFRSPSFSMTFMSHWVMICSSSPLVTR